MQTIILGVANKDKYERIYNINNENTLHMDKRENRVNLSLKNAKCLYYYDVFRRKERVKQIHCLLEDSTVIVFNKENGRIVTIILAGKRQLAEYLKVTNELLADYPPTSKCADLHDKTNVDKLSCEEILTLLKKKEKYFSN